MIYWLLKRKCVVVIKGFNSRKDVKKITCMNYLCRVCVHLIGIALYCMSDNQDKGQLYLLEKNAFLISSC